MLLYCYTIITCLFGGFINGVTGFGALIVMVPLFLLFLDTQVAIPVGVLCSIVTQTAGVIIYRAHLTKSSLAPLILGSLPGVWLGSAFLVKVPEFELRAALGVFILVYALWCFSGRNRPPKSPIASFWGYVAGFASGALGGAFGISGPPAIIYATRTGWPPEAMRGRLNSFFALLFFAIAVSHFMRGLLGIEVWTLALIAIPTTQLASWAGRRLTINMRPDTYLRLLYLLLLVMGASLCWPAVKRLLF